VRYCGFRGKANGFGPSPGQTGPPADRAKLLDRGRPVHKYLKRAEAAGVAWALPEDWDEARVEADVSPRRQSSIAEHNPARTPPDFAAIHEQLRSSKYVTLQLLWEEYRQGNPEGYRYSCFCEVFEALNRPALKPLPTEPFDLSEWSRARVNTGYRVTFDANLYGVPYNLVHERVEILHQGTRAASQLPDDVAGRRRFSVSGPSPK
jgi:hypothetical protein